MKKLFALLFAAVLLTGCGSSDLPSSAESSCEPVTEPPQPTVSHLMVAGDMMSHMPMTENAYDPATGEYNYTATFGDAGQQLQLADYAVGNLETVLAGGPSYSGFPCFNSPDALVSAAKDAGFDLLSTANNHSYDQGFSGVCRTLDVLDETGIAHVGSYRTQEERDASSGIYVADVGGIEVAFLAYTYGLNGFRMKEEQNFAVNVFNRDYYTTLADPDYDTIAADMAAARALDADMIAVIMHWGVEYQNSANSYQTSMAEFLVAQGADLVLGGHPHVLQPYETITAADENGNERQGFVIYSLGNFISNQKDPATQVTAILDLTLTKDPETEETSLTDVGYTPYFMLHRSDLPQGQKHQLVNIHTAMAAYEAGDTSRINAAAYGAMETALDHCHTILGAQGDSAA